MKLVKTTTELFGMPQKSFKMTKKLINCEKFVPNGINIKHVIFCYELFENQFKMSKKSIEIREKIEFF